MGEKTAAFYSLGCKVNQQELESMQALFRQAGYRLVEFDQPADVYVVHTCTVTGAGDKKSRQAVRRAVRRNPQAVVAVTGCYAQVAPAEVLALPGVDLVLGTQDRGRLVELVERVAQERRPLNAVHRLAPDTPFEELPWEGSQRVRAFLKIQEGCRQFCSYCIIPYARGPVRSRDPQSALAEVRRMVEAGYREVVLTGIHIGAYGQDRPDWPDLAGLVRMLAEVPGLRRLRLSSVEPNEFGDGLLRAVGELPQVCPHFHIPLQSGDDGILQRMRRRYDVAEYRRLVGEIRARLPRAAITTDVMVGFPGEGEREFASTLELCRELAFAGLHVFPYSRRSGTPAAGYPDQVPRAVQERRSRQLLDLAADLARAYAEGFLGQVAEVLVEEEVEPGLWEGHTPHYLRVRVPGALARGRLAGVRLTAVREGFVEGELHSTGGEG